MKRNRYACNRCNGFIVTEDRDEGVTPFMLQCYATPGCSGSMLSSMYSGSFGTGPADYIWRKPTPEEYKRAHPAMKEHFDKGGLDIYPNPDITRPNPKLMNPDAIVLQQLAGQWEKMTALILFKLLRRGDSVKISIRDMEAFTREWPQGAMVLTHGHTDSIEFKLISHEDAARIEKHDASLRKGGRA